MLILPCVLNFIKRHNRIVWFSTILCAIFFLMGLPLQAHQNNYRTIDSLLSSAEQQYYTSYSDALTTIEAANTLAKKQHYTYGISKCLALKNLISVNSNRDFNLSSFNHHLNNLPSNDTVSRQVLYLAAAQCWYDLGYYDTAKYYIDTAIALYPSNKNSTSHASCLLTASKIYLKLTNNTKALTLYKKAFFIAQQLKSDELIARCNIVFGQLYYSQQVYPLAISCYHQSFKTFKKLGNKYGMTSSLFLLGNVYYMMMKDDSATYCYTTSLAIARDLGDSLSVAINSSNLSRIALEKGQPTQAIHYVEQALAAIKKGKYLYIESGTYQQLGDIYGEMGQLTQAISFVEKAAAAARKTDNKLILKNCYKSLSELYKANKNPTKAYEYLLHAYRLKDSTQLVQFNQQLAALQAQLETEKKEAAIKSLQQNEQINQLQLQQQQSRIQKQTVMLFLLLTLLLTILIIIYFYYNNRKIKEALERKELKRSVAEEERQRIAKDIHDELGSGLSKIRFLSEMILPETVKVANQAATLHSIATTSDHLIENMKDLVWAMNPENSTLDNLLARIREYSSDYLEDLPIKFILQMPDDIPHKSISKEVTRNILMILKEALQNIVKHANATEVQLSIKFQPHFNMMIIDNGIGLPTAKNKEGNGLRNMESRSKNCGALIRFQSQPMKGTTIYLEHTSLLLS